jgi:hypothetical protein
MEEKLMKILYAKFNKHRLPQFQIGTYIAEMDGKRCAVKESLTEEALQHINSMFAGYQSLKSSLNQNIIALPQLWKEEEKFLYMEYVDGKSMEELLFESFIDNDKTGFLNMLDKYVMILKSAFRICETPCFSTELQQVFGLNGDHQLWHMHLPSISPATVDIIPANILFNGERYICIDPEWVFEGAIPLNYSVYRALFHFYEVKYIEFKCNEWLPLKGIFERYGLAEEEVKLYKDMEESFQRYVFGEPRYFKYKDNYIKTIHTIESYEKRIEHYKSLTEERGKLIDEIINSRGWKTIRKVEKLANSICPQHTRRRLLLEKLISFLGR